MELTKKKLIAILVAAFLAGGVLSGRGRFCSMQRRAGICQPAEGRVQQHEEYIRALRQGGAAV